MVEAGVGGDAVEPGAQAERLRVRLGQLVERLDEHFLGHVLGLLAVAEHASAEVVDGCVVLAVEALEGVAAPGPEAAHEIGGCGGR